MAHLEQDGLAFGFASEVARIAETRPLRASVHIQEDDALSPVAGISDVQLSF